MIKSIFFRALTLLGLTFVLIGCGAADAKPGEGDTAPVTQADLEKMEGSIKDMIANAKGSINTSNGHSVAMKAISILKASQPNNSCSLFTHKHMIGEGLIAAGKFKPYEITDAMYAGGGTGTFSITDTATGTRAVTTGISAVNAELTYEFKNFTIDGNYFLTGKFTMKLTTAPVVGAAASSSEGAWTLEAPAAPATNDLVLSERAEAGESKAIGKLTLATGFAHTSVTAGAAPAAVDKPCGTLPAAGTSTVTVEEAGTAKFKKITMGVTTAFIQDAAGTKDVLSTGAGTNLDMFTFLIGGKA